MSYEFRMSRACLQCGLGWGSHNRTKCPKLATHFVGTELVHHLREVQGKLGDDFMLLAMDYVLNEAPQNNG